MGAIQFQGISLGPDMPELPEVETTMKLIAPHVEQQLIVGVQVNWERSLGGHSTRAYRRRVVGSTFGPLTRRGKYIVMPLEREQKVRGFLVAHLRMSGRMVMADAEDSPRYARVSIKLEGNKVLHFLDVRKFGRIEFVDSAKERLQSLGPEPLGPQFTAEWLFSACRGRNRMIKSLLLDQAFLAGLGNIYVDEALHAARIHPERPASQLSRATTGRLHANIRAILRHAIKREGSSFDSFYKTPEGQPGQYQHHFKVYGRKGCSCAVCGSVIRRIVVSQRGTHFCPRCQRPARTRKISN